MDIKALIRKLIDEGKHLEIMNNPLAQFGPGNRRYLGTTVLPERLVTENKYREEGINYRTVIANAGTRYSPVQLKGSAIVGSFDVELGYSDTGSQLTGSDYDAIIAMLKRATGQSEITLEAMANILQWVDITLNRPLVEHNERNIWQAIVNATVELRGDDGYKEDVAYPNPANHRVNAAGAWSNNSVDPMDDLALAVETLASKGFIAGRIIAGQSVISKLQKNEIMRQRAGTLSIMGGTVTGLASRASLASINGILADNEMPPIEPYNLIYRTQSGSDYFLPRDCVVVVAATGRDELIDLGDNEPLVMSDVLGYTAVGIGTGQTEPGRFTNLEAYANKPPRVEGEAWQSSLPVITEPEALYVIKAIS